MSFSFYLHFSGFTIALDDIDSAREGGGRGQTTSVEVVDFCVVSDGEIITHTIDACGAVVRELHLGEIAQGDSHRVAATGGCQVAVGKRDVQVGGTHRLCRAVVQREYKVVVFRGPSPHREGCEHGQNQ